MYVTKRRMDIPLNEDNILLINTLSSAMDIVDASTYEMLKSAENGTAHMEKELEKVFKERGYIFESKESEKYFIAKYAEIHSQILEERSNRNYTICPTMGCNLRCVYCFEGEENHTDKKRMTEDSLKTILSYIKREEEKERIGKTVISLYGGEPLLPVNRPIVETTLRFARENRIEIRIITNGTTIPQYADLFADYPEVVVQITLDGDKNTHDTRRITKGKKGTFDKIVNSIDTLIRLGITTYLRTNVNRDNLSSLPDLIQFIKRKKWVESGLVYPYVAPVFDYCDGRDNSMKESELYREVLELEPKMGSETAIIKRVSSPCVNYLDSFFSMENMIKPWKLSYCEATSGNNLVFTPDGQISTCLMLAGKRHDQIGRFDENGIYFLKEESERWLKRTVFRLEKCRECKFGLLCGGGCPVAALDINQDIECPVCSDIEDTVKVFVDSKKESLLQRK